MKAGKYILTGTILVVAAGVVLAGCSSGNEQAGRGAAWREESANATETLARGGRQAATPALGSTAEPALAPLAAEQRVLLSAENASAEIITLSGNLVADGTEWYLESDDGLVQLGLGPETFRDDQGYVVADGAFATIRGRIADSGEIEVITCETNGETLAFRTEDGVAMWSGRYRMDALSGEQGSVAGRGAAGRGIADGSVPGDQPIRTQPAGRGRSGGVTPRGGSGRQVG
jgi:hypothetical protein